MEFIDKFMKGKITWKESPTHDWDKNVQPEINKLTALYALIDHGACGLIEPGWHGDYPEKITRGLVEILGEILHELEEFGKRLPEKAEKFLRDNLEKAAIEVDAYLNPENHIADPATTKHYKATIEGMLSYLDTISRKKVVAELAEQADEEV